MISRSFVFALLASAVGLSSATKPSTSYEYSPVPATGNVTAIFESTASTPLDGIHVQPITNSSFQWWYFDAVSTTRSCKNCTLVATFFATPETAFALLEGIPGTLNLYLWVTFENGTQWSNAVVATAAKVTTDGDGSNGEWTGTGGSWTSKPDLSEYVITIDSDELGAHGQMILKSVAAPHYPCGLDEPGQSLLVGPGLGWSNAVPDSEATISFSFGSQKSDQLEFTGAGYHDSNWGDEPALANTYGWYWGHANLGSYSIVWYLNFFSPDGSKFQSSGYVSQRGKVLSATCGGLTVTPTGNGTAYPPHFALPQPTGFNLTFALDEGKVLEISLIDFFIIAGGPDTGNVYNRWSTKATGHLITGDINHTPELLRGFAITEQFALQP